MNQKIYLYTKFSLPFYKKPWNSKIDVGQNYLKSKSNSEYIAFLYDDTRLINKLFFFENITIPTIINQTYQNFLWIIFISSLLPENYKEYLYEITKRYNNIQIYKIEGTIENTKTLATLHTPCDSHYITSRIDDDDGLPKQYFQELIDLKQDYDVVGTNKCLLLSGGEDNNIYYRIHKSSYLLSCGLATKNRNIFSLGDHSLAGKLFQSITLSKQIALMACGDFTLTKRPEYYNNQLFNMKLYQDNYYE
jgi:hypothetical protein